LLDPGEAGAADRGARSAAGEEDGLRRLARGGRGLHARGAARLDAPRVHGHRAPAAGEPLGPGAHERLRAALARAVHEAPPDAAAGVAVPLPRAGRRGEVGARDAEPGGPAQPVLLLGLLAGAPLRRLVPLISDSTINTLSAWHGRRQRSG